MKKVRKMIMTLVLVLSASLAFAPCAMADSEAPTSALNSLPSIIFYGIVIIIICGAALLIIRNIRKR